MATMKTVHYLKNHNQKFLITVKKIIFKDLFSYIEEDIKN